ncbi:hypothetical protein NSK_002542 [Nannochloropsis salina CCMP1776]|uniref:Uncharacterized protein n=1 Tax=Nannochloropsis salina CCMP1776 TaxID=1027361 RepID=A0A4D9D5R5_9STRA|nr:hypothetical protein NSK_002542 [Nannochloropsis salina CCMP1776]|eukprot:TFJ86334.1 hypothetical protein NSK_002542 [Nannochloropsis salina CCMP1776]
MYQFALHFLASNINLLPLFGTRTPDVLAEERKVTSYVPFGLSLLSRSSNLKEVESVLLGIYIEIYKKEAQTCTTNLELTFMPDACLSRDLP